MYTHEEYDHTSQWFDAVYALNRWPVPVWQMDIAEMFSHFWQVAL